MRRGGRRRRRRRIMMMMTMMMSMTGVKPGPEAAWGTVRELAGPALLEAIMAWNPQGRKLTTAQHEAMTAWIRSVLITSRSTF
jgi:hypothetical protein